MGGTTPWWVNGLVGVTAYGRKTSKKYKENNGKIGRRGGGD
jgi:hypothetical protein